MMTNTATRVRVLSVEPSTMCPDTEGAVDAEVEIDEGDFVGGVTLFRDPSQATVNRRAQLGVCGTPLEVWASSEVADALGDDDDERSSLIDEIVGAVQRAADAADLT
jgi:hypothetical protein